MSRIDEAVAEIIAGPKPIAFSVSTIDVRMLYTAGTSPEAYNQLLLAKLKDAGGPVEGVIKLRLAHGRLAKWKDDALNEQDQFTYMWLPDAYVEGIQQGTRIGQA